jgi:hypothetical protein
LLSHDRKIVLACGNMPVAALEQPVRRVLKKVPEVDYLSGNASGSIEHSRCAIEHCFFILVVVGRVHLVRRGKLQVLDIAVPNVRGVDRFVHDARSLLAREGRETRPWLVNGRARVKVLSSRS